ncbi:MAG: hypothetical protein CMO61_11310 [Verrucomicrobiales bacterium]|nr:hypothetical protein [Verrucomicrobiales bacterium]
MIRLLTELIKAYTAMIDWKRRRYVYELEDDIDELAADGSPAAKLRIERLAKRLKFERERITRSSDRDSD